MFARTTAARKIGLAGYNAGDPLNFGLVAWIPGGDIESSGTRGFNLISHRTGGLSTVRDLDGWGTGPWYGLTGSAASVTTSGTFGGRQQNAGDYGIRPTLYHAEALREKPTRFWTVALRINGNYATGFEFSFFGVTTTAISWGSYGANNVRYYFRAGGSAEQTFNLPVTESTVVPGKGQSMIVAYDGTKLRVRFNQFSAEFTPTTNGDVTWTSNDRLFYQNARYFEDVRVWSRALSAEEMMRWVYEGAAAGALRAPSRRFAVVQDAGTSASGTLSATFDALTLSSAGTVAIAGALSKTLGDVTVVSAGTVAISGALSKTLDALALSSTGTVADGPVGSLSATLGALTLNSAGTVAIAGVASNTLAALTLSGVGAVAVRGSVSVTLGALTLVASETTSSTTGALSKTLGTMTLSATGSAPLIWVPTTPTAGSWVEETPAASSWTRVLH